MPQLATCFLPTAFRRVKNVRMENAGRLEEVSALKQRDPSFRLEDENTAVIRCEMDMARVDCRCEKIVIADACCGKADLGVVNFARFASMKELRVGNRCFANTTGLCLMGLPSLESVMIGSCCFLAEACQCIVRECEQLKEVRIGEGAFNRGSVCEIEHVPALEMIEVGCGAFLSVSRVAFEGVCGVVSVMGRFASTTIPRFWLRCLLRLLSCSV